MQPVEHAAPVPLIVPTQTGLEAPWLLQNRQARDNQQWETTRRALRWSTLTSLWVTGALGTVVALNRPTLFGESRCEAGNPIFGEYGCGELSIVHGISAITSVTFYTASEVLELAVGPGERQSPAHRALRWIHRAGIAVLPLAGILSRYPEVIGITEPDAQEDFGRVVRSVHAGAGYVVIAAYTITF